MVCPKADADHVDRDNLTICPQARHAPNPPQSYYCNLLKGAKATEGQLPRKLIAIPAKASSYLWWIDKWGCISTPHSPYVADCKRPPRQIIRFQLIGQCCSLQPF
jgi:hypothetical protein